MPFVNKFKILVCTACLMLVGQGFALDCVDGTGWGDFEIVSVTPNDTGAYEIDTPEKLAWFSCKVEHDNTNFKNATAILTKSIDMQGKLFIPIAAGTGTPAFAGIFDGQGFTISNLYIDGSAVNNNALSEVTNKSKNGAQAYAQNIGLVGVLSGTIKNVTLKDAQIYAASSAGSTGMSEPKPISVGTFVGWAGEGSPKILNCVASGTIVTSGATNRVGGIVGNVKNVTISNCVSSVNIAASGEDTHVGGIVGALRNNGAITITSCVYSGTSLHTVDGSVGAIAGNYESVKTIKTEDLFYSDEFCEEFENESDCKGIGILPNGKKFNTEEKDTLNSESVVCELNGGKWSNGACTEAKSETWSVGQSDVSMNGSDGYKITFNANGGNFASGAKTSKVVANGGSITADEITQPTKEGLKFAGWSLSSTADEPDENLGVANAAKTLYAVWYNFYNVTFKTGSETMFSDATFPDGKKTKTISVAKHGVVSVDGFAVPISYKDANNTMYYFTGWAFEPKSFEANVTITENDTLHLADRKNVDVVDDVTLYAVWTKARTFSVTFDATLHGKTEVQFVKIITQGETVSRPDTVISDAGYKVVGWCVVEEGCTAQNEYKFNETLDTNLVLHARWDVVLYSISYENMDNASNTGNPTSYDINSGTITFVAPTRKGYTFGGWFYDQELSNPATEIKAGSSGDKTIYAKWTPITFTIQYLSGNTISATVKSVTKEYNKPVQLYGQREEFAHAGCTHDGWSKADYGQNGYNKDYELSANYTDNADIKLYPHWTCNTYNITYEMYGVEGVINHADNPDQYTGPAAVTLKYAYDPNDSKRMPMRWYFEPTFKTVASKIQDINKAITLYAGWYNIITIQPGTKLKNFNKDAGKVEKEKKLNASYTLGIPNDKYKITNYTLDGWSLSDGGEKVYDKGFAYRDNVNITLYPHWTANTHTITYNNVETSELPEGYPETYTHEAAVTLPIPSRNGYEFLGWFVDGEFNGDAVIGIPEGQTEDKVFFAKWSDAVEYTATYNLNGGSMDGEESFTFTIESNDIDLATPTKNGYTFVGWLDGVTSDVVTVLPTGSFGDRTLTARWSDPIEYTITYENVNGAANENATSYTIEQTVPLNALEKDGFAFRGWFTNAQFEGNAATEISAGASGDTTFYAKWLEIFKITYAAGDDDGVTGEVTAGTKTEGEDATLSNTGFTREGYTQTGWKTEDGSVTYAMGATYTTDASVTLYPIWNVETYNIVYHNIEGATFETANPETYTVEDGDIALNSPAKTDYHFLGWSLKENSTEYVDGIAAGSTGEANFYANWEKTYPFLVNDYGAIKVYEDENGKLTAELDGASSGSVKVITDEDNVVVDKVVLNRTFTVNETKSDWKLATIVLPFTIDQDKISGAEFFEFLDVDLDKNQVTFCNAFDENHTQLVANTPYIVRATAANITFDLAEGETVKLNTSEMHNPVRGTTSKWEFRGTYSYKKWEEGDPELGSVYGYTAKAKYSYAVGQFAKNGAGAFVRPFRANLFKVSSQQARRYPLMKSSVALNTASIDEETIPSSLDVVIVERETEQTTIIGKLNTATGEIKIIDNWFDMKGRKLNGKPTTKGIYYYNGKRVMVK